MNLNDIDIYWKSDEVDTVSDTMYIKGKSGPLVKTFSTNVYRLGLSIKNYDLIKDFNPEFIIERYKKSDYKRSFGYDGIKPAKYRLPDPYSDYVPANYMENIDPTKVSIYRPMIFPITGSASFYRIYAENYFSQVKPPRVSGGKDNFYKLSSRFGTGQTYTIYDDTNTNSVNLPPRQIGVVYCRIRIRISDNFGRVHISKPLNEFRIRMIINYNNGLDSIIKYDMV
jgi:hypothetical protein